MRSDSIMTHHQALYLGHSQYNNGKPCPQGHDPCYRYTATYQCTKCVSGYQTRYRQKQQRELSLNRSGYARINMLVHKAAYEAAMKYLQALNLVMGVPDSVNDPASEQDHTGIPREWAVNPFERAPGYLPLDEIESRLRQNQERGYMLDFSLDDLQDRHWPHLRNTAPGEHVAPPSPSYELPDPEERHF